jgi:phenylpropionate dioxygenase-like ring-hydroxylating dioxygenase large terminal subunit
MEREFSFPLPNGWFQIAYSGELEPGEVMPLHYFGTELVLFRGEDDGRARVMDAYCPHLGAHLGYGGRVVGNSIRCPFHAWEFGEGGKCSNIPYAKRIPPKAAVTEWPVDEKNGMVLMYHDTAGRKPSYEIPELPEYRSGEWTDYYLREFKVKSRSQELAENIVDPPHFKFVHGTAEIPEAKAAINGHIFNVALSYPIASPGTGKMQYGKIDIESHGFGVGWSRFRGIVDTTVIIGGTPIDEEYLHIRLSFMVRRLDDAAATDALAKAFVDEIVRQFSEDLPIWENKAYLNRPVLCDGDGPIGLLRDWARQFYELSEV